MGLSGDSLPKGGDDPRAMQCFDKLSMTLDWGKGIKKNNVITRRPQEECGYRTMG